MPTATYSHPVMCEPNDNSTLEKETKAACDQAANESIHSQAAAAIKEYEAGLANEINSASKQQIDAAIKAGNAAALNDLEKREAERKGWNTKTGAEKAAYLSDIIHSARQGCKWVALILDNL